MKESATPDFREFYRATRNLLTYKGKLPSGVKVKRWKELTEAEQHLFVKFVASGLGQHALLIIKAIT